MGDADSPRILIIDNDEGMVNAVTTRLEAEGYRCVTAHTGAQGLAEFSDDAIDLVVTDLNMPSLDGADLIQRLRRQSDVPIIVITGFSREYADQLAGASNITIVEKPFEAQAFLDLVTTALAMIGT